MRSLLLLGLFTTSVLASDMDVRIKESYSELHRKAKVYCDFKGDPVSSRIQHLEYTVNPGNSIDTKMLIDGKQARFKILPEDKKGMAYLEISNQVIEGSIGRGNKIDFKLNNLNRDFVNIHDLKKLNCAVDIAVADTYVLKNSITHINVHPHGNYDYQAKTGDIVLKMMSEFKNNLALLDDYNMKATGFNLVSFINNGGDHFSTNPHHTRPLIEIPNSVDMIVSPAGHNRFEVVNEETTIHYTGGNHNYCMFNNSRRVLDGFFQNPEAKTVNFHFYPEASVVQRKGVIGGDTTIPLLIYKWKGLYVLSEIFAAMTEKEVAKYKNAYNDFFIEDLRDFRGQYFKTLTLNYDGNITVIKGRGERELIVNFSYD